MILIADSGSTKTQGVLISPEGDQRAFLLDGINPLFHTTEEIIDIFQADASVLKIAPFVLKIHFFGAGCSSPDRNARVEKALKRLFANAEVYVDHDLMGAAIALYKDQPLVSCILGTGANSAFFDGQNLIDVVPSLGYVLGDEGSGADIGKVLIRDFLYGNLPFAIQNELSAHHNKESLLDRVYRQKNPNRFLASTTKILSSHIEEAYTQNLLKSRFSAFEKHHLQPYAKHTKNVGFVGGIAFHFQSVFKPLLEQKGWKVNRILEKPMDGLIKAQL
ncbi:MAG: hypothetical protein JJU02_09680 [Cryomorphaceae bacterium]|nr:hypothetical protein [Cryomorphaceae bacterium]